eukprot:CAMPEP_0206022720 /NCGR_PEP_ID=MMETSP1464-20131121/35179_1 /ASSEMBLY_ACC=CAM_ASM_001124 /TAXON_ID=119497 /ORGANISM="Exanthemachrysis gayraliae, Strain RCC1523" /LENGTH=550 /DNA_ID=CAMNT_0053396691 /DNA_START=314 /DNA_END=1963 /DNA_ORIENTATION=+
MPHRRSGAECRAPIRARGRPPQPSSGWRLRIGHAQAHALRAGPLRDPPGLAPRLAHAPREGCQHRAIRLARRGSVACGALGLERGDDGRGVALVHGEALASQVLREPRGPRAPGQLDQIPGGPGAQEEARTRRQVVQGGARRTCLFPGPQHLHGPPRVVHDGDASALHPGPVAEVGRGRRGRGALRSEPVACAPHGAPAREAEPPPGPVGGLYLSQHALHLRKGGRRARGLGDQGVHRLGPHRRGRGEERLHAQRPLQAHGAHERCRLALYECPQLRALGSEVRKARVEGAARELLEEGHEVPAHAVPLVAPFPVGAVLHPRQPLALQPSGERSLGDTEERPDVRPFAHGHARGAGQVHAAQELEEQGLHVVVRVVAQGDVAPAVPAALRALRERRDKSLGLRAAPRARLGLQARGRHGGQAPGVEGQAVALREPLHEALLRGALGPRAVVEVQYVHSRAEGVPHARKEMEKGHRVAAAAHERDDRVSRADLGVGAQGLVEELRHAARGRAGHPRRGGPRGGPGAGAVEQRRTDRRPAAPERAIEERGAQ